VNGKRQFSVTKTITETPHLPVTETITTAPVTETVTTFSIGGHVCPFQLSHPQSGAGRLDTPLGRQSCDAPAPPDVMVAARKDLIIRGGVNIYPAEVESVLREHPAVLECDVF